MLEKIVRNWSLIDERLAGATYEGLAAKFDISPVRAQQICHRDLGADAGDQRQGPKPWRPRHSHRRHDG
jgi:hypothetical protein